MFLVATGCTLAQLAASIHAGAATGAWPRAIVTARIDAIFITTAKCDLRIVLPRLSSFVVAFIVQPSADDLQIETPPV
jgi:hypothetical protein